MMIKKMQGAFFVYDQFFVWCVMSGNRAPDETSSFNIFSSPFSSEEVTVPNFRSNVYTGLAENCPQDNNKHHEHVVTLLPSKLEREFTNDYKKMKKDSVVFDVIRQLVIVLMVLLIFFGYLFESKVNYDRKSAHLFRQGLCSRYNLFSSKYAVVFDAGSTGSRVHVYEFQFCGDRLLHLLDEIFEQTKPGLSSFNEEPEEGVESLEPLLRQAWRRVPRTLRRCTPVVLKATAGLRLLPAEKVSGILGSVRSWLDDQPFHLPLARDGFSSDPVSVIDGSEEAVSAWISVNFLKGHIGPESKEISNGTTSGTSVVLELGGGSAQIVFDQSSTSSSQSPESVIDLKIFGRQFQLYQHSFLGYGLMEARKSVKSKFLDENKETSTPLQFPCYAKGHDEVFSEVKLVGSSGGWNACRELVQRALFSDVGDSSKNCKKAPCSIGGVHQPTIPKNSPIYALSFINDRIINLGLNGEEGYTLSQMKTKSEEVCSSSNNNLYEENPAICLDLSFIYSLLHDGYGIADDRLIHSGQKIKGYETGWTLGSALSVIETAPTFCSS